MPDRRRSNCQCCGKHRDDVGEISWRGLCITCAQAIQTENAIGISTKTGYPHLRRMRGYAKMVERELLDAQRTAT